LTVATRLVRDQRRDLALVAQVQAVLEEHQTATTVPQIIATMKPWAVGTLAV
jgi:hypothetical protein